MKSIVYTALGLTLLFTACNDKASGDGSASNDHAAMSAKNSEHSKSVYAAFETGDVSKLDSFIASDFIDHDANMGKDIVGLDSMKAMAADLHNHFDGLKFNLISDATSLDGEYHYAMVRMTGTPKTNIWGLTPGKAVDYTTLDVVKIKDGKAMEHWSYMSQGDINAMMGVGAMPADSTKK